MLIWDLLSDSCTYFLRPPDDACDFPCLSTVGVPARAQPKPLQLQQDEGRKELQEEQEKPKRLDTLQAPTDLDHSAACTATEEPPFLFLYLSSEDSRHDNEGHAAAFAFTSEDAIAAVTDPDPEHRRKQATMHIS